VVLDDVLFDFIFSILLGFLTIGEASSLVWGSEGALGSVWNLFDFFCSWCWLGGCSSWGAGCRQTFSGWALSRWNFRLTFSHLLEHHAEQGRLLTLASGWRKSCFLSELLSADLVLLALHGDFGKEHRQGVVHLVVLQVLFDQKRKNLAVGVFVDLRGDRVLPLESCWLFGVRVSVVLDGFENLGAQLGSQTA